MLPNCLKWIRAKSALIHSNGKGSTVNLTKPTSTDKKKKPSVTYSQVYADNFDNFTLEVFTGRAAAGCDPN